MTDAGINALCGDPTEVEYNRLEEQSSQVKSLKKLFRKALVGWAAGDLAAERMQTKFGQCKSLRELYIRGPKITKKGLQIALKNLPHLQILDHEDVFETLAELHQNNEQPLPRYSLVNLRLGPVMPGYRNGSLKLVASICPLVTEVCLLLIEKPDRITDEELLGLLELETLHELSIFSFLNSDILITFDGGLVPIFQAHGFFLQTLSISSVEVDLGLLMELCPNLRILGIDGGFRRNDHSDKKGFKQLEILTISISSNHDFPVPPEYFLGLLPASLTFLSITFCRTLTDDILQQVFEIHSFPNLRDLHFSLCNFVSKKSIDLFMNETNALEKIKLFDCNVSTQENVDEWRKMAKRNNWNLSIDIQSQFTFDFSQFN